MDVIRAIYFIVIGWTDGRPAGAHDNVAKLLLQIGNSVRRSGGRQRGSLAEASHILIVSAHSSSLPLPANVSPTSALQQHHNAEEMQNDMHILLHKTV